MKRVLEDELISLAERILKLKNRADIHQLKRETGILYEKLSILAFAESHFGGLKSEVSKDEFKQAFAEQFSDIDEDSGHYKTPDGMAYNPDPISEPNTEKIKDIVSQMPPESEQVDLLLAEFQKLTSRSKSKSNPQPPSSEPKEKSAHPSAETPYPTEDDFKSYGVSFDDLPHFEPKADDNTTPADDPKARSDDDNQPKAKSEPPKPEAIDSQLKSSSVEKKSLNDRLKKGIKIGLNDRIAFTKHLFGGSADDYNRVLSQLNTMSSFHEASSFIQNHIKPEYNSWDGKEAIEARFMEIIEHKFE